MKNSRKLALIMFLSSLYFYSHVGTLYLQTRGLSLFQVSTITAVMTGAVFLMEVPTGVVADKVGRKWSVVNSLGIQALGEYFYLIADNYTAFIAIAFFAGTGWAFLSGASDALVYDTLPERNKDKLMKKASGEIGAAHMFGFVVAPLVGGLVVSELILSKFLLAILLTALSVTIAFAITLTLKEPKSEYKHSEKSPLGIFRDGVNHIANNKKLKWIAAIAIFTTPFIGSLHSLYQPRFVSLEVSSFWIGGALSLGALLGVGIQKYAYLIEEKFGKAGFTFAVVAPAVLYIVFAFVVYPVLAVLVFALMYGVSQMRSPLLSAYQNKEIPSGIRATVLSLINMFTQLYLAMTGIVFGLIADFSIPFTFVIMGVAILISSVLLKVNEFGTVQTEIQKIN
jgi:MFS family permease